jgi:hypothetical protein
VAAPDLLPGGMGGPGPLAGPGAQAPWVPASTRGGPRPSRSGPGPWQLFLSTSLLRARGGAGPASACGEVRRPCPQLSGPDRTPCRPEAQCEITDNLASLRLDTLAGDISVCIYRQMACAAAAGIARAWSWCAVLAATAS